MSAPRPEERTRLERVAPADWSAPTPADRYHLVVIGGGTAGLVTAAAGAILGARTALVEREALGGDCLNTGCVPSKALIRAARAAAAVREAERFGVRAREPSIDFPAVMRRLREARATVAAHDDARRFRDLGVDVFFGDAAFASRDTVRVGEATLRFKKAVIASGARPSVPPIEGLADVGFHTNETIFEIDERPERLLVVGGGPIGAELAQAFARLGSRVTVVEAEPRFLPREDPEAAETLAAALARDGVDLRLGVALERVSRTPTGAIEARLGDGGASFEIDSVLVATGRTPNVEGLGLDRVGVVHDRRGVEVDDRLRTTNPRIFAAGDVCLSRQFTHAADAAARTVVRNALFPFRSRFSRQVLPWCTYTSPEVAGVGATESELHERGVAFETLRVPFDDLDRAIVEDERTGFVKIHVAAGKDRILGATIVGEHAGEAISELTLAMTAGLGLGAIANTVHPYPTRAEALRRAADEYNRGRLTPRAKRWLDRWFRWTG